MHHPLLEKQIRKYLLNDWHTHDGIQKMLDAINESYYNYDRDKELSDHAFSISENEYAEINDRLLKEINRRKRSVTKLIDAIRALESEEDFKELSEQHLEEIIDYLKIQIDKRKAAEKELVKAKEIAEKAAMARAEFLSMMSHEIRTPLNAVVGFTYLLLQSTYLPEQKEQLHLLKFSAENLLVLINDILDFNKIESGKVALEQTSFNLAGLIAQIRNSNLSRAQENNNDIQIICSSGIPSLVTGDPLRIGQILNNLVSNAVKFTKNGLVVLEASLLKKTNKTARIQFSIKDNGIGIAQESQRRIFEVFTQASDSITRRYGGTGLGLAICNRLLALMQSHISLESTPGKGSVFSFVIDLPYSQTIAEPVNEKNKQVGVVADLSGTRILLVEDSPINVLVASTFLERWHARIDVAENGKQAIEKVQANSYHIVLMDLNMPEMNGFDACKIILQLNPKLPVVALTASAMLNVKDMAFEAGMIDYITKPFEPNDLYEKIRKNRLAHESPL